MTYASFPCRTMYARQLRSRHSPYKKHIVQPTVNHFDGILSLPLLISGLRSPAFAFNGQGASRHVRSNLFEENPYFRAQIIHLAYLAEIQGFLGIIPAIDECENAEDGLSPTVTH